MEHEPGPVTCCGEVPILYCDVGPILYYMRCPVCGKHCIACDMSVSDAIHTWEQINGPNANCYLIEYTDDALNLIKTDLDAYFEYKRKWMMKNE